MKPQDCPSFDHCDAMLCPLGKDVGWLDDAAWFPDEDICNAQMKKPRWVEIQRRIARVTKKDRKRGFFTVRMLEALTKVTPAIKGIDVDTKDEARDVDRWCARRKRQQFSPEDIERLRESTKAFQVGHCATSYVEKTSPTRHSNEVAGEIGIQGQVEGVPPKTPR